VQSPTREFCETWRGSEDLSYFGRFPSSGARCFVWNVLLNLRFVTTRLSDEIDAEIDFENVTRVELSD